MSMSLIETYYDALAKTIKYMAYQFCAHAGNFSELSDLVATGWLGACKAEAVFDPKIAGFYGYAKMRAFHEMQDYLRTLSGRGRETFTRAALPYGGVADGRALRHLEETNATVSLAHLASAAGLTECEEGVIRDYGFDGHSLTEIGERLHVSESRACQIKAGAIKKMRAAA